MSTKLKTITSNSWLVVLDNDERVGLLTNSTSVFTLMLKDIKRQFASIEEVNAYFKEDVFAKVIPKEKVKVEKTVSFINGFPTNCTTPNEVVIPGVTLPLYSKDEKSSVIFSAGFYCMDFPKQWQPAYSPKYATLANYNYHGPFSTEAEMKHQLKKSRSEKTKNIYE